jgi:hypothetical protein
MIWTDVDLDLDLEPQKRPNPISTLTPSPIHSPFLASGNGRSTTLLNRGETCGPFAAVGRPIETVVQ